MHYYAKINVSSPPLIDNKGKIHHISGYLGKKAPDYKGGFNIDVERKVKKVEKDMQGTVLCKVGEYTYRFNTPKEALNQGKLYLEMLIGKNPKEWKIDIDYPYD